jgi:hypothetical protein
MAHLNAMLGVQRSPTFACDALVITGVVRWYNHTRGLLCFLPDGDLSWRQMMKLA